MVERNKLKLHGACLCLLILSSIAGAQDTTCAFTVSPSTVVLDGKVTSPVPNDVTLVDPAQVLTLSGTLTLPAPCPSDTASLEEVLASSGPLTGTLKLSPASIKYEVGTLADIEWVDVGFATEITFTTGSAAVKMTGSEGYILSTSILSSDPDRIEVTDMTGSSTVIPSFTLEGTSLSISLPDIAVPMRSVYNSGFVSGVTDYTLKGTLVPQAPAGAGGAEPTPSPVAPTTATPPTPSIIVPAPSPIAPVAPIAPSPSITLPPTSSNSPPPALQPCVPTVCSERSEFNFATGQCECLTGWTGPNCDACISGDTGNDACTAQFGAPSTCSMSPVYLENTAYNSYLCDLQGTGIQDVVEPGTFYVSCNTTGSSGGDGGQGSAQSVSAPNLAEAGPRCTVEFALKGKRTNPITCEASMCTFTPDASLVQCLTTNCQCTTECADVQGVLDVIDGNPCTIDCDATGTCTFDIEDFFVKLTAPCTTHQCLVEGFVMSTEDFTETPDMDYNPIIAAVPLMCVTAVAAVLSLYLLFNRSLFTSTYQKLPSDGTPSGTQQRGFASGQQLRPSHPVEMLQFTDLTCTIPLRSKWSFRKSSEDATKTVLKGVSGNAAAGELVGLLGPSGSGKTTLLALLASASDDRGSNSIVTGTATLDGRAIQPGRVAYVQQDSTLLPTLTVEECLRYSALLRLPKNSTSDDVQHAIHSVIEELGLSKVAHSRVGSATGGKRGVSGGERRRVSIGMELVTNPSVIILDEPSSGLDSQTAYNLMVTLKHVASSGRIVMLSFHQPSPAMFNLLDRVFLMSQGHCLFMGPPAAAEPWLAEIGLPCPAGTAVAEHMLYCACDDAIVPTMLKNSHSTALIDKQGGETLALSAIDDTTGTSLTNDDKTLKDVEGFEQQNKPVSRSMSSGSTRLGFNQELAVLYWRTLVDIKRNPSLMLLHWATALAMGIFVGCIFWQVGNDISGAQNRAGGLFFALAFFAFSSLTTVDLLVAERHLVHHEVRSAYYRPESYLISKAVLDGLLLRVIPVFLYSAAFYPMMGLQSGATQVALFLMILCTFALTVGALSLAVSIGSSTAGKASLWMNMILLLSLLLAGFFVNVNSIPDWISWLHYFSVFYYGYSTLVINETASLLLNFVVEGYAAVKNVRGLTFLRIIGIDASQFTTNIIVLDCMYALCVAAAFMLIRIVQSRELSMWRFFLEFWSFVYGD